jgi:hypothetical protein
MKYGYHHSDATETEITTELVNMPGILNIKHQFEQGFTRHAVG